MLSDDLLVTLNNTSTQQRVPLLDTSAKQRTTVFAGNQNTPFDWTEFLGILALSSRTPQAHYSEAYQTMLASENILRRDWEQPEEDAAWADL
jgi:hypothetical protein